MPSRNDTSIESLKRRLRLPLATAFDLRSRASAAGVGMALVYHKVGPVDESPERSTVPALGVDRFEEHVRYLTGRYRLVLASELQAAASVRRRGERLPVAITFDDDLTSHVRWALPVLRRHGAPATFFLSGASLRQPTSFWWENLDQLWGTGTVAELDPPVLRTADESGDIRATAVAIAALPPRDRDFVADALGEAVDIDELAPRMEAGHVRQLSDGGHEIGFHTRRHYALPTLPDDELETELTAGRSELEDVIGRRIWTLCYPHGAADARVGRAARAAGFRQGFRIGGSRVEPGDDPMLLPRFEPIDLEPGHTALEVARAISLPS